MKPRFCLIGFGEVGQILAADLYAVGELSTYDILFPDPHSIPSKALQASTVQAADSAPDAVANCDVILCAVTAGSDLDAAQSVVPGVRPGAWYVDFNSVSPKTKEAAAKVIEEAGGRYVEAAVMSPFPPKRLASLILLGGPHAAEFQRDFGQLFTGAAVFSAEIGKASAAKMCRSVMIKGIEALLTESLLAARYYGVEDTVLKSLSDLFPIADWEKLACYMISRSLQHGVRRAEEMREVAETVRDAGLAPTLSTATAERHDWAAGKASALSARDLRALLDNILEQVRR